MDPLLSQNEVDALREAMREGPVPQAVRGLELCADDRLLRRALPEIEEGAAASGDLLRLCITRAMRGAAQVVVQPAEVLPAEDARAIEERTGGRLVLTCEPARCDVAFVIQPPLVFLHVQREFGGSLEVSEISRNELTGLERSLLFRLAPNICDALNRGFTNLGLRFTPRSVAARATVSTVWPRQISAVVLSWRITVGGISGNAYLLLPPMAVEAVRERLSGERGGVPDPRWRSEVMDQLRMVEIEVVAELGRTQYNLSRLLGLQVGDVVRLDRSLTEQVPVLVDGRVKLRGRPGTRGDTVTLTIEEIGES